ncbi:MAG: hypothetical protein IT366_04970 [Candidatus Hydrogenedentes bacterium]|nr:hypothetical protein [Candidatus Hydrogenedentota bacterium]
MPTSTTTPRATELGTPCARSWSAEWIAAVNAKETELNHRICGARLPDATPCTTTSDHPTGRCKLHGGCELIGAPRGNRNAVVHGLYSRRLRTCSTSCPYWQSCPCASPEIASMPPGKAPTCPYQLMEYNTVVTDALAIAESQTHPNPIGIHAAHNVAMLQVLVNTAAAHLNNTPLTGGGVSQDPGASSVEVPNSANPNAVLAFIRLMREFRANLRVLCTPVNTPLFRQKNNLTPPSPEGVMRHIERAKHDTAIDPDSLAEARVEGRFAQNYAKAYLRQSIHAASQGRDVEMCEAFDTAALLDEPLAEAERDHVLASYRPAKQSVSEELAEQILGNLHLPPLESANKEEIEPTVPPNPQQTLWQPDNPLHQFLDEFIAGQIPPEAFPLDTPIRAHAEKIYTGPRNRFAETAKASSPTESS